MNAYIKAEYARLRRKGSNQIVCIDDRIVWRDAEPMPVALKYLRRHVSEV